MPSLVLLFSSLWVAYLASMGFDFNVVAPLLLAAFPLCLAMGYSFFGGLHPPPVMAVQQVFVLLVLLQRMSTHPSTPLSYYRSGLFFAMYYLINIFNWLCF